MSFSKNYRREYASKLGHKSYHYSVSCACSNGVKKDKETRHYDGNKERDNRIGGIFDKQGHNLNKFR